MNKKILSIIVAILIFAISAGINAQTVNTQPKAPVKVTAEQTINTQEYKETTALNLVENPSKYMNQKIKIKAKFDKFSAIGLDYPPVKREAKTYISFLIKRENTGGYNIPLSELKLMLKRDYAEKELVNLESGDEIELYGTVFSVALGDPWVDVEKITILTQKDKKEVKDKK